MTSLSGSIRTNGPRSPHLTSLNKRLAYLGIADFDYLSARVLLRHGIVFTGLPKAADAFEKVLKLNLILEAKISRNENLEPGDLIRFRHDLIRLLDKFELRTRIATEPAVREYFAMLEDAAKRRYPEFWSSYTATLNIELLDHLYGQFRRIASENFPAEEQERARCFGTFIGDAYSPKMIERIKELGGESPWDLLAFKNHSLENFNLDPERKAPRIPI